MWFSVFVSASRRPSSRRPWLPAFVFVGALVTSACGGEENRTAFSADDVERGRVLAQLAGCGSCHHIPGLASANGEVGPPLDQLRQRVYLAGVIPNNFENLVLWIASPQELAPGSAMPNMNLSPEEAKYIAAFLYAQQ